MPGGETSRTRLKDISRSVWALGFVSMLMDISSEMIHALLPVYLVTVLGASMAMVGLIEGLAEATASIVKVFSGAISDWLGRRKVLAVIGYGIAALTKPIFPVAGSVDTIIAARFVDRLGKGIRGAPRDALIADITPQHARGASFGLRQSLDTIGAFAGPMLAIGLMALTANHFQTVFWLAAIPGFLSVTVLLIFVKEPKSGRVIRRVTFPLRLSQLRKLSGMYWLVVLVASVFTLARFSEAFLILKAESSGLPILWVPLVLVVMNIVYALSAFPVGAWSDRINRFTLLSLGFALVIIADLILALAQSLLGVFVGIALWGLHLGFTQGLLITLVSDTAPEDLRGTAFGMFHLITGIVLFAASLIAGGIWGLYGSSATFLAAAAFTGMALLGLWLLHKKAPALGQSHLSG